jgi:hypothetical protein
VGSPGTHPGTGKLAVADWWLKNGFVATDENEPAAKPAKTIESAKKRIASFIVSNL